MITRQQFIHAGAALVAAPLGVVACAPADGQDSYETAVQKIWRPLSGSMQDELALRQELVRYATLAPSGHNTQCWKFRVAANTITILPDFTRRTPVVDPDDHHLFVSLGCALENMAQASLAFGLKTQPQFDVATGALNVGLEPTKAVASPSYHAIPERQCTRGPYDGKPLAVAELKALELAGTGNGVRVMLLTAPADVEKILAFVIQGNSAQMNDAAFVKELKQWLRFGAREAVEAGDGMAWATPPTSSRVLAHAKPLRRVTAFTASHQATRQCRTGWAARCLTSCSKLKVKTTSMRSRRAVLPVLPYLYRMLITKPTG